jgi:restriction system protein
MAKKKFPISVPTYDQFLIPTLNAIKLLGGSGSIDEINEKVYELKKIDQEVLEIPHNEEGLQSEVDYRLAWARTYLKKYGLIENSSRGVWALVDHDMDIAKVDDRDIVRKVREETLKKAEGKEDHRVEDEVTIEVEDILDWKEKLLNVIQNIDPSAFERLAQRLLRESGFVQVEVTGKVGDGGIDGKGIVRISGFLSFHVIFQCKRYKGSITPSQIRDFRGAMQGRADKGLFITTGTFTREAIKEATRDGAPPIDLIDGELLCDKLKEFGLGVKTELIEKVNVIEEWWGKV